MVIPKHISKTVYSVPLGSIVLAVLIALSSNFFKQDLFRYFSTMASAFLILLVGFVILLQDYTIDRLYRKTIVKEPLISFTLSEKDIQQAAKDYKQGYRQYMKRNLISPITSLLLGLLLFLITSSSENWIPGLFIGAGFAHMGLCTYLAIRVRYLPPDLNNATVVMGVYGITLFGKFHHWTPNGYWLKSVNFEEGTEMKNGVLHLDYNIFNGLMVSLITIKVPVPYTIQDELKKCLDKLPMTVS